MEKSWNIFWKAFGISKVVQGTFAVGLGICGFIGFLVVPGELFLQDRAHNGGTGDAIK
ncbi:MAG: hypothetical protein LBD93_08910 [Treponema sp.]|nr:hypothetical protein [Treponema sp.]